MVKLLVCSMKLALTWLGGIVLFLMGVVGFLISDTVIRLEISKRVVLEPGSDTYDEWKLPDIPISLEVYVFNITNMAEVIEGGKPYLQQRGPYVYSEHREKYGIAHHDNGTVTYQQRVTYHFDANKSVSDDSDIITSINIPLVTLVEASRYNGTLLKMLANVVTKVLDEKFYITRSVRDIVWGYTDRLLDWGHSLEPEKFYTATSGVFINKNNTYDGTYTIHTGADDIGKMGMIDCFNGSRMLPYWTSDLANMVNGTDGTIFHPFIGKKDVIRMFLSDICRSVYVLYHSQVTGPYHIPLYRFRATKESFDSKEENPANAGFCTPADHCMGSGVLNVSVCQHVDGFAIPAVVSSPHFLYADQKYLDAVQNLHPNENQHSTNLDIEPNTGLAMNINKRVQINIHVAPLEAIGAVKNIKEMVVPLLWVNETAQIDDAHAHMVKHSLLIPKMVASILVYSVAALGGLTLLLALNFTIVASLEKKKEKEKDDGNEDDDEEFAHIDVNSNSSISDLPAAATAAQIHAETPRGGGDETAREEGDDTAHDQSASLSEVAVGLQPPCQDNQAFDGDLDTSDTSPLIGCPDRSESKARMKSPSINSMEPATVVFSDDGPVSDVNSGEQPLL